MRISLMQGSVSLLVQKALLENASLNEAAVSVFEKIQVAPGIYWVAVPAAELYVLCGCPADSVKHLSKKGLLLPKRKNGIVFESGPNAILLSDVTIQKGDFANLAEFPVLQMLYRQGMLLPNHPNNTGCKPMLIGREDQVNAQMDYIYRGNYGLVSLEEILATGISQQEAEEMMRIKLKFAFGKIHPTQDLLDARIVEEEDYVELRQQVFIRRMALNVYEFLYQGETLTIDLNLKADEEYQAPYRLGVHPIRREYFAIVHTGEGDGWDINRPCMASILVFQGRIYLIDAGPNITHTLAALGIGINEIEGIFHTHAHDDHFAGLTTLVRADHRIKYYATPLVRVSVTKKLCALMTMEEKRFGDYFDVQDLKFDIWNDVQGLEIKPLYSPHPVETNIFYFRTFWNNKFYTYSHLADIASFEVLSQMITDDVQRPGISAEHYSKVQQNYLIPTQVKKLDIGGGLIHGQAQDFRDDSSGKIILAHTTSELTIHQKEIGSEAPFGTMDILIHSNQDYVMRYAFEYLRTHFPTVSIYEIHRLLNYPTVFFNAGSILIRKASVSHYVYLVLTGSVEFIDTERNIQHMLSAGSLLCEISGLLGVPSPGTYRAASALHTLQVPSESYLEFVKRNNLYQEIERLQTRRDFLQDTWLFGEMISYSMQAHIAKKMELRTYQVGESLQGHNCPELFLVERGELQIVANGEVLEVIRPGEFCLEETILFDSITLLEVKVTQPARVYNLGGEILRQIPIVQWKLLQTFERRMKAFGSFFLQQDLSKLTDNLNGL